MVDQDKIEFSINKYLTIKFDGEKTIIYVGGEEFLICKTAILDIPKSEMSEIKSIDDIIYISTLIEEEDLGKNGITPQLEFWAHCSNLQVWAENNYNSDLLDSRLSFPLLRELADLGDPIAKKIFKEEIARRESMKF